MIRYLVLCVKKYIAAIRYGSVREKDSKLKGARREYYFKLHELYSSEIYEITHEKMFGEDSIKSITVG